MRFGHLEVVLVDLGSCWKYEIVNHKTGTVEYYGFRDSENHARNAGFDDASLLRSFG